MSLETDEHRLSCVTHIPIHPAFRDKATTNDVENDVEKLNARQRIILERIKAEPTISASALASTLEITSRTIQRDLKYMQGLGIIAHEGPDKGGVWRLK